MTRYTKLDGRRSISHGPSGQAEIHGASDEVTTKENGLDQKIHTNDPKALLKRAKLLRLKAKKAKSDEVQSRHLQQAKALEREASAANGSRGILGKRKGHNRDANVTSGSRRRIDPDQRSEFRRAKRAEERKNKMRCFVCRAFSHAAKDCPQNVSGDTQGKDTVGICFRCGSTEHSLAQCRRPRSEQADELPFATCYICSEKGHLASKCPQNKGKSVYPDGGECKVCGSVEHLARDCPRDPRRITHASHVEAGGVGLLDDMSSGGADEDEFHVVAQHRLNQQKDAQREWKKPHTSSSTPTEAASAKVVRF